MAGLPQHHHHGGDVDEGEEVGRLLLVARRHPAELLGLLPEPLAHVALPVQVPVDVPLLLAALLCRDHRLRPAALDLGHQRLAVVAPVGDHRLGPVVGQQRLRLPDVRLLRGGQRQLHRVAQRRETAVDLGPEAAPASAQRLLRLAARAVPLFLAPAAQGWARAAVESRINHPRSSSRSASRTRRQTPFLAQRSKRRQTLLGLPNRSGRSAQGMPVRATYRTASTKRRLSSATPPRWPGSRSLIRPQSASEIACRGGIAGPPWVQARAAFYPDNPTRVPTT